MEQLADISREVVILLAAEGQNRRKECWLLRRNTLELKLKVVTAICVSGSQEAMMLRGVTCNREQEGHGGRRFITVSVPHRAPYNIRRSSTSGTEEVEVPFTSDEQRRR